ncbi:hypothetical protein KKG05_07780 [bacterium]|nr:hypothetical protein [bacterium]MBU1937283.1 hypothetical protein [bacterium]
MSEHSDYLFHPKLFEGATVCLFEDDAVEIDLFPLTVLVPVWDLLAGTASIREHVQRSSGKPPLLRPRAHLRDLCIQLEHEEEPFTDESVVFLSGRVFELKPEADAIEFPDTVCDKEGNLLFARRSAAQARELLTQSGNHIAERLVQKGDAAPLPKGWNYRAVRHIWDLMLANPELLQSELQASEDELFGARLLRDPGHGVEVCNRRGGAPVYIGAGVKLHPGVVLGNHKGAIFIDAGTEVLPHSYLEGPLYVGRDCVVNAGAKLYGGSSFGSVCKLGGEITQTIFQGYSNKQHDGFLGHAHVGRWVNIGAGTNNSDLKNNYTSVKVEVAGKLKDTDSLHVGCFLGDHTKTGINTMLNTGTVVGIGCNVYGAGFPPRFVPSFHWGGAERLLPVPLSRTIDTARVAMSRRSEELSKTEEELLRRHYELTVKKGNRT